jgi:hypothetical protein
MRPAEIVGRLQVLNADLELSGSHQHAELVAQAAAYLAEYEGIVHKLDICGARVEVGMIAVRRLMEQVEHANARALALEAEVLYYQSRLGEAGKG